MHIYKGVTRPAIKTRDTRAGLLHAQAVMRDTSEIERLCRGSSAEPDEYLTADERNRRDERLAREQRRQEVRSRATGAQLTPSAAVAA